MAQWKSQSVGLLSEQVKIDATIVEGKKAKMYSEPELSPKGFLNVKVELEDGTKYLASISDTSGRLMSEAWGTEMTNWLNKDVTIEVRQTRDGKPYAVLVPFGAKKVEEPKEEQKPSTDPTDYPAF